MDFSTSLYFDYPELPQSVNKLYSVFRGRKVLTAAGRSYKTRFVMARGGASLENFLAFCPDNAGPYELDMHFFFEPAKLFNANYGVDKRIKSPFANLDVSNLIKVFEDAVAELTGIRDSNHFSVRAHKRVAHDGIERASASLVPCEEIIAYRRQAKKSSGK